MTQGGHFMHFYGSFCCYFAVKVEEIRTINKNFLSIFPNLGLIPLKSEKKGLVFAVIFSENRTVCRYILRT